MLPKSERRHTDGNQLSQSITLQTCGSLTFGDGYKHITPFSKNNVTLD